MTPAKAPRAAIDTSQSPPALPALQRARLDYLFDAALGFHLGLLLERADPSWKRSVHDEPDWLVGTLLRLTRAPRVE